MWIDLLKVIFGMFAVSFSLPASADTEIYASPASWRLQNYIGGSGLVAWFTGSSCTIGLISFSSGATNDDRNRFASMVLSAKLSGKSMGVFYETTSGSCQITSFYLQQ